MCFLRAEEKYTNCIRTIDCSGVGEGGAGGATAPQLLKVGGHCPPLFDMIAP